MVRQVIVLLASLFLAATAAADGPLKLRPGMTGVADIGSSACQLFNDMHPFGPAGLEHHVLTWAQGYIFAKSGKSIDGILADLPPANGWDFDSLSGYIVNYCSENPEAKVSQAAIALWTVLSQGESAPKPR